MCTVTLYMPIFSHLNELSCVQHDNIHMVTDPDKSWFMTKLFVVHMFSLSMIVWLIQHISMHYINISTNSYCTCDQGLIWIGLDSHTKEKLKKYDLYRQRKRVGHNHPSSTEVSSFHIWRKHGKQPYCWWASDIPTPFFDIMNQTLMLCSSL